MPFALLLLILLGSAPLFAQDTSAYESADSWAQKRSSEVGGGDGDSMGSFYEAGNVALGFGYLGATSDQTGVPSEPGGTTDPPDNGGYDGFAVIVEAFAYDFEKLDARAPVDLGVKVYLPFLFKDDSFEYGFTVTPIFHFGLANSDVPFINLLDFHFGVGVGYAGFVDMNSSEQYAATGALSWDLGVDIFMPGYQSAFYFEGAGLGAFDAALSIGYRVIL